MESDRVGTLKEHEKFYAFIALLGAVLFLAWLANGVKAGNGGDANALRDALIGIIGILGVSANALFRTSDNAPAMNKILQTLVDASAISAPVLPNTTTHTETTAVSVPTEERK